MYVFDADSFIAPYNTFYHPRITPNFWSKLSQLVKEHSVIILDVVYFEVVQKPNYSSKSEDWLIDWMKSLREYVVHTTQNIEVVNKQAEINEWVMSNYMACHARTFLDGADPWLIAYAMVEKATIVTFETFKNEEIDPVKRKIKGKVKLPNVARKFGVSCIKIYEFLRTLEISF